MLLLASVVFLVFSLLRKLFCALNSSISQLGFSIRSTPMTCSSASMRIYLDAHCARSLAVCAPFTTSFQLVKCEHMITIEGERMRIYKIGLECMCKSTCEKMKKKTV